MLSLFPTIVPMQNDLFLLRPGIVSQATFCRTLPIVVCDYIPSGVQEIFLLDASNDRDFLTHLSIVSMIAKDATLSPEQLQQQIDLAITTYNGG